MTERHTYTACISNGIVEFGMDLNTTGATVMSVPFATFDSTIIHRFSFLLALLLVVILLFQPSEQGLDMIWLQIREWNSVNIVRHVSIIRISTTMDGPNHGDRWEAPEKR